MNRSVAKKKLRSRRGSAQGALDLKKKLEAALRAHFKHDTIDVSDGYKGNVHVLVVSREFDGKSDYQRQELLHALINAANLSQAQIGKISLLLALSPAEIK